MAKHPPNGTEIAPNGETPKELDELLESHLDGKLFAGDRRKTPQDDSEVPYSNSARTRDVRVLYRLSQAGQKAAFLKGLPAAAWQERILPLCRTEPQRLQLWQAIFDLAEVDESGNCILKVGGPRYPSLENDNQEWYPTWDDPEVTTAELVEWQRLWMAGERPGDPNENEGGGE